ncbi:calcium-translocating P-type ATPase, PMCA-type [Deferribacter autotrophicus]|uniref:P-type Ca(2+) transporter n=1 Tax=Deferribacter autotrophicus TaxID=500465 RepID=A0A5A8F5F1_9BACT|nr:calcium-translocating P-type ATPase, PMCA-type [Deferribacter autotrophicus]KAA0259356.1 calcium-translocating P-type ATPase, PMCA-type [Deferribacter autotrophicus]
MNWHQFKIDEIFTKLETSSSGISNNEAKIRLANYGYNKLEKIKKKTALGIFLSQFKDLMIIILIISAIIAGIIGEAKDTIVIIIIVLLNAIISFIQEYRAEKSIEALKQIASPSAKVIRDGVLHTISSTDLVPGDIVIIEAGDIVPADIRLFETNFLQVQESILTGESTPVEKKAETIYQENVPIYKLKNIVFKGTVVTYGNAKGVVVATGMNTEIGKIASLLQDQVELRTPLQIRLNKLAKYITFVILILCLIIFVFGILRGLDPVYMLFTSISVAVAAIPEALPAVITISLALGAKKMLKLNALIRKLPAVETLGSVTYICSDKTGTITLDKMTVEKIFVYDADFTKNILTLCMVLNNNVLQDNKGNPVGDPTEVALMGFGQKHNLSKESAEEQYSRVAEIPFDSERKLMTTIHKIKLKDKIFNKNFLTISKGAIEEVLKRSNYVLLENKITTINKDKILKDANKFAENGMRVIAYAFKLLDKLPENIDSSLEDDLIFVGFVGLIDPPREEVFEAIKACKQAGIKPVMITGDHPITAKAIAEQIGIIDSKDDMIITGEELKKLDVKEFEHIIDKIKVYARVDSEQKLKIVLTLQNKDEFVAVTGDGVNDAPALKKADIGISMGINGTDVAKEASDMVLLDDNFSTIVKTIKEGRRIYDNIKKFITYTLTTNAAELLVILFAPIFGLPIPFAPIQILYINLITDGLPGLAFTTEPAEKDVMLRPPKKPQEGIFTSDLVVHIIILGLLMTSITLLTQYISTINNMHWQTITFTVLVFSQLGNVLGLRSKTEPIFKLGLLSNKFMLYSIIFTALLQLFVIYSPIMNSIFKTSSLTIKELIFTILMSTIVFIFIEARKILKKQP